MNKALLIGNLTRDPELRATGSGVSVCSFTIAVNRRFTNQQGEREADFLPIVVWRQQAENCAKYLRKGSKVGVAGMIQTRTYDAQDGSKRYVTEIVADEVEFLDRFGDRSQQQDASFAQPTKSKPSGSQSSVETSNELPGFAVIDDDELPF